MVSEKKTLHATLYPIAGAQAALGHIMSDQIYVGTFDDASAAARAARETDKAVYLYSFDYKRTNSVGAFHSQDLTFVIGVHPFNYSVVAFRAVVEEF